MFNFILKKIYKNFFAKIINLINLKSKSIFIIDLYAKNQKLYSVFKQESLKSYKQIQIKRNKLQLFKKASYVNKNDIKNISMYVKKYHKNQLNGICMGTRDNKEVFYFMKFLKNSKVIGTDISPTIKKFENTTIWNFNTYNPKWKKKYDFLYSNSFDHCTDPKRTLNIWFKYLKKNGLLFIDHSTSHGKRRQAVTDPCAIETELFPYLVLHWLKGNGAIIDYIQPQGIRKKSTRNKILIIKKFN